MSNWLAIPLAFLLLADADIREVNSLRPPAKPVPHLSFGRRDSPLPERWSIVGHRAVPSQSPSKSAPPSKNTTLQETSKLALIRYVSGEFAKAIKPLPAGKEGFHVTVGKPLETEMLDRAVATHGPAVSTGDKVQIHQAEFRDHQIIVDVNAAGAARSIGAITSRSAWGQRISPMQSSSTQDQGPPGCSPAWAAPFSWNSTSSCRISPGRIEAAPLALS